MTTLAPTMAPPTAAPFSRVAAAGIARGLCIEPGTDDDGWRVVDPVLLSDGTRVRLLKDGEAMHCWYDAVCSARKSVMVESYIFNDDEAGRAFKTQFMSKARAGVKVFLTYDSFGSHRTDPRFFDEMRTAGVNVQEFQPLAPWRCSFSWRPFNRNHRKLIVVDDEFAGFGGVNIANEYGGYWVMEREPDPGLVWRDCGVSMKGSAVRLLATSYLKTWMYVTRGGRSARALFSHNLDGSEGPVGLLSSVPSMAAPVSHLLSRLLRQATRSIDLTSAYFAPGDELVSLLCRAARRGVRVRLMLPSRTDYRTMVTAARSFYAQLLDAGVIIYERQQVKLHAKTLLVDGEISVLGSTNFDYRSIDYNCELAAIIRSRELGEQMQRMFENDIAFASQINAKIWRRRPLVDRFVQWAVNRSRTLL